MKAMISNWDSHVFGRRGFDDFDQLFSEYFQPQSAQKRFNPTLSVQETEEYTLLSFDVPGLDEKDIDVKVEGEELSVSGERVLESAEGTNVRSFSERHFGKFKRSFALPESIESDKIEADYSKGVLKILLPKKEKAKPRKLDVKVSGGRLLDKFFKDKGHS